jgi:hypothetical protein
MHVEGPGRPALQDLLVDQLGHRLAGGHIADARLLGDFPLAGELIEQIVALADPPLDDAHYLGVFGWSRHELGRGAGGGV